MSRRDHPHDGERRPGPSPAPLDELPLWSGTPARETPMHIIAVRAHPRRLPGEAPPSGRERRDAALAGHQTREASAAALTYVREQLAALDRHRLAVWQRREWAVRGPDGQLPPEPPVHVTADDADRILRDWAGFPAALRDLPKQNWRGSIFNPKPWVKTGHSVPSTRDHMNYTSLPCWRLRDAAQERSA